MIHERKETKEDSPDFLSEGNFLTRHMEWRKTKHKVKVKVKSLSHVQLFATPWTVAYQASLSMRFSRQEYRSGLPFLGQRIKTFEYEYVSSLFFLYHLTK